MTATPNCGKEENVQDILYNIVIVLNQYLQQDLLSKWSGISIFCVFAESGPCVVYALWTISLGFIAASSTSLRNIFDH